MIFKKKKKEIKKEQSYIDKIIELIGDKNFKILNKKVKKKIKSKEDLEGFYKEVFLTSLKKAKYDNPSQRFLEDEQKVLKRIEENLNKLIEYNKILETIVEDYFSSKYAKDYMSKLMNIKEDPKLRNELEENKIIEFYDADSENKEGV